MCCEPLVQVEHLCKTFKIYSKPADRLREFFLKRALHRNLEAVKDISFTLDAGGIMGIIGENGSGKSTLLKLIAGVLIPDAGAIHRGGRIAGLLELGTGFNPELSGRKNIYMNGIYLGMSQKQLQEKEDAIIDFSELGQFMDDPLKNYSSGMVMRLAFAIAIHSNPSCFIIDEALSVGDVRFQQKCFGRLREFGDSGGGILFVSHDLNAVKLLCHKVMVLNHGQAVFSGNPDEGVNIYNELQAAYGNSGQNTSIGYGNGSVRFTSVRLLDKNGAPASVFTAGEKLLIHFTYQCSQPVQDVVFGFTIRDRFGQDVFGINSALLGQARDIDGNGGGVFEIDAININWGAYTLNMAAHTGVTHLQNCFHWWDNAASFEVTENPAYKFGGHTMLDASLRFD